GIDERIARRAHGEVRGGLALQRDIALTDSGALADPGVRGVDLLRQVVIGDDVVRQEGAAADGTGSDHVKAACSSAGSMAPRSRVMRPLISACPMSIARSMAPAKPMASVLPWAFTTTPPK